MSTVYYADTFTSILRWSILVVIACTIALAIVVSLYAKYRRRRRTFWGPGTMARRHRREYSRRLQ